MKPYRVEPLNQAAVNHLIRLHYLKKWPGVVMAILGLLDGSEPIGCIVFALPPRETAARYGVTTAWELARLFILDATPKNTETWFMSRAIQWVRKTHPQVELLVSYADPSAGHRGTIYRAGNWIQDGVTDQERQTPRFDLACEVETLFGSQLKRYGRAAHAPEGMPLMHMPRVAKYRFVFWLSGHEAKRRLQADARDQFADIRTTEMLNNRS